MQWKATLGHFGELYDGASPAASVKFKPLPPMASERASNAAFTRNQQGHDYFENAARFYNWNQRSEPYFWGVYSSLKSRSGSGSLNSHTADHNRKKKSTGGKMTYRNSAAVIYLVRCAQVRTDN